MKRMQGKIALITGASRGIGESIARLFIAEGAIVYLTDIDDELGSRVAEELGSNAFYLRLDVREESNWATTMAKVASKHNALHVVVNNAGITGFERGTTAHDPENTALTDWHDVHRTNLDGVFLGCKHAIRTMRATASRGSIINISSLAGLEGTQGAFAYTTSKWAVRGMSKAAAQELGRFGVRVNSVHPGFIDTDMMHQTQAAVAGKMDKALRFVPLGRTAEPMEVARLVLFLASDESSYCTNSEFVIDGGMHR